MTRSVLAVSFGVLSLVALAMGVSVSSRSEAALPSGATQGNVNCDTAINAEDTLAIVAYVVGISVQGPAGGCPIVGTSTIGGYAWGDLNCVNGVTVEDAIPPLKYKAGLPVEHFANCVDVGQTIGGPTSTPSPTPNPCTLAGWTVAAGSNIWTCNSATSVSIEVTDGNHILLRDNSLTKTHVEADLSTTNREASLMFRAQDVANGYLIIFEPDNLAFRSFGAGGVFLGKFVGGAFTDLASGAFTNSHPQPGGTAHMVVEAIGNQITVSIDGDQLISFNDTTFSSGKVGLRAYGDTTFPCDATWTNIEFHEIP